MTKYDAPRARVPTVVGKPTYSAVNGLGSMGVDMDDWYIGTAALMKRGLLNLHRPVVHGKIEDWDGMTQVWRYCYFNVLRMSPQERRLLVSEPPSSSNSMREKMATHFFETRGVPGLIIANQASLAIYSTGRTTGVVVESGHGLSSTVPIFEGHPLECSTLSSNLSGWDVTEYLSRILAERGYDLKTPAEIEMVVQDIKEKLCYLADDFDGELERCQTSPEVDREYELPCGETITIGSERFRAPEILFKPSFVGLEGLGIHEMTTSSILKCDVDVQDEMARNICIGGGSTLFEGFASRLSQECKTSLPNCRVISSEYQKDAVWIGGSIVSTLTTFDKSWMTRQEYEDVGSSIVRRRCF